MGSKPSESWEKVVENPQEINGALLMALMDETHVEDAEDERLGCVIRSLEKEIGPIEAGNSSRRVESEGSNYDDCMDCSLENKGLVDGDDCSRSTWHINDPFVWADVDMVPGSNCDYIGNWYLDTCPIEMGMAGFEELRDYSYCYGDTSIEHAYSPLWQET
ncbi:hypothetical protein MRB53_015664 [Persea americana]|uniref:Uncharacterized protein n=1 Tax=Persea americana TaxID=3435 RepID=A0ACC2M010_PERAE|nr:hypothetical protein MRB53_015664 [Persea americana]